MKPNAFAAKLNGMDLNDFPSDLSREACLHGLVVVLGMSADTVEFIGGIEGEADVPEGDAIYFDLDGLLPDPDDVDGMSEDDQRFYYERKKFAASVDANWQQDGYAWTFTTVIPHARFVAHKDGKRYSRGIVFHLADCGLRP